MIRLILCIVIVFSSTIGGFYFSSKLSKRKDILLNFELELKNTLTKIRYNQSNLSQLFENNFMGYSFDDSKKFSLQWNEMLNNYKEILTDEDIRVLADFSILANSFAFASKESDNLLSAPYNSRKSLTDVIRIAVGIVSLVDWDLLTSSFGLIFS